MSSNTNIKGNKFSAPSLDGDTQELYTMLYGEDGGHFVEILRTSPDEIAVVSRLIAYLKDRKEA